MAIEVNITPDDHYFTGEDKTLVGQVFQADGVTPQNITGWAISWMVKRKKRDSDSSALIEKTVGDGIVLTTASSGIYTITLTDTDIADLEGDTLYHHEAKRTDAGFQTVLTFGTFMLPQAVHA